MKIEKNKLVNRAQVLNKDIQLGIIAYSVAEMASIAAQSLEKRNAGKITEEEDKAVLRTARSIFAQQKSSVTRMALTGLYVSYCLVPHLNSTQMWKARTAKTIFLLLAGYLGLQCIRASLWIPLILCILLFTFIIQLKNKEL